VTQLHIHRATLFNNSTIEGRKKLLLLHYIKLLILFYKNVENV